MTEPEFKEEMASGEAFESDPVVNATDTLSDEALSEEETKEESEPREESSDWEKRCLAAEAALADSLEFASLYASEGGELDAASLRDSTVYRRFCELRSMGLSVREAFSAADSARERKPIPAAKDHLLSSPSRRQTRASRLSGEELAIARSLLGEEYSTEELMKLYRRVTK